MKYRTKFSPKAISWAVREVTRIVGKDVWEKRTKRLKCDANRNEIWNDYVSNRYGLELASGLVRNYLRSRGKPKWPPDTTEQQRFYSFSWDFSNIYRLLSERGRQKLKGALRASLDTKSCLGPLAFETRVAAFLMARGYEVWFNDYESDHDSQHCFDFLASFEDTQIEVECKYISSDIGRKIHHKDFCELSCLLDEAMSRALSLEREPKGRLLRVLLPDRLPSESSQIRNLSEIISAALNRQSIEIDEKFCEIVEDQFSIYESPFSSDLKEYHVAVRETRYFLEKSFGISNNFCEINYCPGRAAVIVCIKSLNIDHVIEYIVRNLRKDSDRQFTRKRASILFVHLSDLDKEQLSDLFTSMQGEARLCLEKGVRKLFGSRPYLYGVAFLADGETYYSRERQPTSDVRRITETGGCIFMRNEECCQCDSGLIEHIFRDFSGQS